MIRSSKRILVVIIMAVLVSSVVAGAISLFNRSSSTNNNNSNALLNARLNDVVNFCLRSLPNGTTLCDNQLLPVVNRICAQNNAKQLIDACSDGKVIQYYKTRNMISSKSTIMPTNISNSSK